MSQCRRCGHGQHAHDHYRGGTDCAVCDCPKWRPRRWWRLYRGARRQP